MAYVLVMDPCLDEKHADCTGAENTPTDPEVVGGGICICRCHHDVDEQWLVEVRRYSMEARTKREASE